MATRPVKTLRTRHAAGFTLIELLVVFALLALIVSLVPIAFNRLHESARNTATPPCADRYARRARWRKAAAPKCGLPPILFAQFGVEGAKAATRSNRWCCAPSWRPRKPAPTVRHPFRRAAVPGRQCRPHPPVRTGVRATMPGRRRAGADCAMSTLPRSRGFSLLEILVAFAILAISLARTGRRRQRPRHWRTGWSRACRDDGRISSRRVRQLRRPWRP